MTDWQPIETAPKDGRPFLVCYGEDIRSLHRYSVSNYIQESMMNMAYYSNWDWRYKKCAFWTELPPLPTS